jgi:hypothetical protein
MAGDDDADHADELGEDEHQQQAAQPRQHPDDEWPLTEPMQELVHDDAEQDDRTGAERLRYRRVEEKLAIPEHGRWPGLITSLLASASRPHSYGRIPTDWP